MVQVSASVLACDTMQIGQQILQAVKGGVDFIHVDVMDGTYVNNLSFGPQHVIDLRALTNCPISVHLELNQPERYLDMFSDTGADILTFQLDCCHNPIHFLKEIKKRNMQAGVGIGPAYSVDSLKYILHLVDRLTLMSVEPGYGGQTFEDSVYEKINQVHQLMRQMGKHIPIAVDGGINIDIGRKLVECGADVLIVGSSLFSGNDIEGNVCSLKNCFWDTKRVM